MVSKPFVFEVFVVNSVQECLKIEVVFHFYFFCGHLLCLFFIFLGRFSFCLEVVFLVRSK